VNGEDETSLGSKRIAEEKAAQAAIAHGGGNYREAATLYGEAARYAADFDLGARARWLLLQARERVRLGYVNDALAILDAAAAIETDTRLAALIRMERTATGILREGDLTEAARSAKSFLLGADAPQPNEPDAAETTSVAARIMQMAYVYYEIDASDAAVARARLIQAADALEAAGRIEESLSARQNHADWPREPAKLRAAALEDVAKRAHALNRPNNAAQALVAAAFTCVQAGDAAASVAALLDAARADFAAAENAGGALDITRVESLRAWADGENGRPALATLAEQYLAADRPRDALSILMDASQQAHEQGRIREARAMRQAIVDLAEATGLLLSRTSSEIARADILTRARELSDAVDVCLATLARPAPRVVHAQIRMILSSAYSFSGESEKAIAELRSALVAFEALGASDLASMTATALANQLLGKRTETAYREARELAERWLEKDVARGDTAQGLQSLTLAAQARWQNYIYAPPKIEPKALLVQAEALLTRGDELAAQLPERQATKARGGLSQLRGMVRSSLGQPGEPETGYRIAAGEYEKGGYAMEAANSRYIVGVARLNAAADALREDRRQDFLDHFAVCERNLNAALEYYSGADMRLEAANTRYMLARHYKNALRAAPPEIASKMQEAILVYLHQAFADLDAARREFAAAETVDAQTGKLVFADQSGKIVELALELLTPWPGREADAWAWTQNGKSRALSDLLGVFAAPPQSLLEKILADEKAATLLADANALASRLRSAGPEERPALRARLNEADVAMAKDPRFADYLSFMKGAPVSLDSLASLFETGVGGARAGACVDWIRIGDSLHLIVARPGETPTIVPIAVSYREVENFFREHMAEDHLRRTTLKSGWTFLRKLEALVAPLERLTNPEELLIFCPTGRLHGAPLHALRLNGTPLIARNPVLYSYGLGVTRHAVLRRAATPAQEILAVFGDPTSEGLDPRPEARAMAAQLATRFGVAPKLGEAATKAAFLDALKCARNIHFQGHAIYDVIVPLNSYLCLAGDNQNLRAQEIMTLSGVKAEQVTLGACETAANQIRTGDEPLGLIPAFELAGARSLLAALWPVSESSSAAFMSAYYAHALDTKTPRAKVDALRETALELMKDKDYAAPYHWGAYVLHGDWR
jgi:CHAT domain-containing protein